MHELHRIEVSWVWNDTNKVWVYTVVFFIDDETLVSNANCPTQDAGRQIRDFLRNSEFAVQATSGTSFVATLQNRQVTDEFIQMIAEGIINIFTQCNCTEIG